MEFKVYACHQDILTSVFWHDFLVFLNHRSDFGLRGCVLSTKMYC